MKKIALKSIIVLCFIQIQIITAQETLSEISLEKQVNNSSLIVEGKVISKNSFWDLEKGIICTSNIVEVYKTFKGETNETIEVITKGGTVGLTALQVSTSLKLRDGDIGIFMLTKANQALKSRNSFVKFKSYGAMQGFYKYNLYDDLAINPFNKKQGISSIFYNEIMDFTNAKYRTVNSYDVEGKTAKSIQNKNSLALGITTFFPTTATAGTKSVLTITGTDFGTIKGKVGFSNADEGGNGNYIDALNTQVISWNDTQITVEIPSEAGTGKIRVTDNDDNIILSTDDLTITHSELNVIFDIDDETESGGINGPIEPVAYPVQHINDNENGGYTWEMQTDFFNDTEHPGAKVAFERAFENWRCTTEINWEISDVASTVDVIGTLNINDVIEPDAINIIRFDNGDELPEGVLGNCDSWYNGCSNGIIIQWYVSGMDIVFNDDTTWYFGTDSPPNSAFDFESVALHELGHGHQLGHVINTDNIMHFSSQPGSGSLNRVLSVNDITGATNIQNRSTEFQVCNESIMLDYTICNLSVEDNDELDRDISLFPNPTKNKFFIKNESFINIEGVLIYDVSGRLILNIDILNTSKYESIDVSNLSRGVYFVDIHYGNNSILKKIILD